MNLFNYERRKSSTVEIGRVPLGGENPVRIQTMTDTSTRDIRSSIEQIRRITATGADYIRLTTQGTIEVEALRQIREQLHAEGNFTPLVADIHFNPNVADAAAAVTDKIRINPGNYTDTARTFRHIDYDDASYAEEINKLETRFKQLLEICKAHQTALRIGVNHGSLSDRIMSRYGDTPEGIVESCMEFLRVCRRENFNNVVISIKASNTVIMVKSVRLLIKAMEHEQMNYPLHLGVTEAGEGEDGRIKSAVGIGTLLADGIGDTIRVSLSEPPENEIPVARKLAEYITGRKGHPHIDGKELPGYDHCAMERHKSNAVGDTGGENPPIVIFDASCGAPLPSPASTVPAPDYVYLGAQRPAAELGGIKSITDIGAYRGDRNNYPLYTAGEIDGISASDARVRFLELTLGDMDDATLKKIATLHDTILIIRSTHVNPVGEMRSMAHAIATAGIRLPMVFARRYDETDKEEFELKSGADMGTLLLDGFGDGIEISNAGSTVSSDDITATAYTILQAARRRISKTEYISCPGCGRTQFDLQKRVAEIKAATSHLVGIKIGVMGCIVNGPGEMADADYGYVGAARGRISLYKGKECVEKNIPEEEAVERLLEFIEEDRRKR